MNAPYRYIRTGRAFTTTGLSAALLALGALAGCSGGSLPQPVPKKAQNPIEIKVEDITSAAMVKATDDAMSALGIPLLQSDKKEGYVESKWLDVTQYVHGSQGAYPLRERLVQMQIELMGVDSTGARRIGVKAVYRPYGIDVARRHDRLVPTDHPGYQLAMRVADQVRLALINDNVQVMSPAVSDR